MLHIILHILAIIGIIILCILGLFILLLLLVLLCPLRYRISGSKQVNEIHFNFKISYLFHIITARFSYPDPGCMEIRVFGIPLKSKENKVSDKQRTSNIMNDEKDNIEHDKIVDYEIENKSIQKDIPKSVYEEHMEDDSRDDSRDTLLRHPIQWIRHKFEKIYYTIKRLYDKIKHIIQNITYYKDILTEPANQALYRRLKDRILVILKKIMPKHFDAEIVVGTGSPDTTGYLCGLYGILLPVLGNHVNMTADFDQPICNGCVNARGHITFMTILIQAAKVYFDKQLWIFVKQLKREE
ncbi:MAG TPA: hypothetical protein VJY54_09520 [Lachnospiraceae bacterium]|nr:hypothetical protein [Lachnospiraceae bacterium]